MLNVFVKKSAEELYVQLSDGRMMLLEDIVRDYEELLKEEHSIKNNPIKDYEELSKEEHSIKDNPIKDYEELLKEEHSIKDNPSQKAITIQLKVGEWFRIVRDVIAKNQEKICRMCNEAGTAGKKLWENFKKSNKIADENPGQYPRLIETYIFECNWTYKTDREMEDMCKNVGDGICDEVICYLELQMRICNGESAYDLVEKGDELPNTRFVKLRNGGEALWGSQADDFDFPPSLLCKQSKSPNSPYLECAPYAFRRVLS